MTEPITVKDQDISLEPLETINLLAHTWLVWVVKLLPWVLFGYVFINAYFINNLLRNSLSGPFLDNIQLSGFVASGIGILALQVLLQKSAHLLNDLWLRGLFPVSSKSKLMAFSRRLEMLANHRLWQLGIILFLFGIVAVSTIYGCSRQNVTGFELLFCNARHGWIRSSKSVLEVVVALSLAPLIWRMVVVAWGISRLGRQFELNIIWNHPDRSGGLLPVGSICFWLAGIIAIPATYLGGWLILCQGNSPICGRAFGIELLIVVFEQVLFLVIILSLVSFVWPLWSTHQAMQREKQNIEQTELSAISQNINLISKTLVANAEKITRLNDEDTQKLLAENEVLENKLRVLQDTYSTLNKLPIWPFDKNTVLKVASSQGIPLLGLTGIGADILDLLNSFLSLGQSP